MIGKNIKHGYISLKHLKRLIKVSIGLDISHESIKKFSKQLIHYIIETIVSNFQGVTVLTHNGLK